MNSAPANIDAHAHGMAAPNGPNGEGSAVTGVLTGNIGQPGRVLIDAAGNLELVTPEHQPGVVGAVLSRLRSLAGGDRGDRQVNTGRLTWYVAADDRWHDPATETAVRQRRIGGTPVTETRVRVPNGDVVQRVYSVPTDGGITVVEFENDSTLPVVIALAQRGVLTQRPISSAPVEGIDLPDGAISLPLGHKATIKVGLPHRREVATPGALPSVPDCDEVVRGWVATADRAGQIEVPESVTGLADAIVQARCDLVVDGVEDAASDPVGFVLGLDQLMRMGLASSPDELEAWIVDVASAVDVLAPLTTWQADAALAAAERVLLVADEPHAAADVGSLIASRSAEARAAISSSPDNVAAPMPSTPAGLTGIETVAWVERVLVSGGELLPTGVPAGWEGQSFCGRSLPTLSCFGSGHRSNQRNERQDQTMASGRGKPSSRQISDAQGADAQTSNVTSSLFASVSFAVRWHGELPAVLWEQHGGPIQLSAPLMDAQWSSDTAQGEALWPSVQP